MMILKTAVVIPTLFLSVTLSGCSVTHPKLPVGINTWQQQPANKISDQGPPRIQVMVCYGPLTWTHTAIRLVNPTHSTVYWDPGGSYGLENPRFIRRRDLIANPAPTLDQLWAYRMKDCLGNAMEVFEWDLPIHRVRSLQDVLIRGSINPKAKGTFDPNVIGSDCSKKVCLFLQKYLVGRIDVPKCLLFPHDLGRHLWTQRPSRVILYRKDRLPTVYIPPPRIGPPS